MANKIYSKVVQFLNQEDWQFAQVEGTTDLRMGFKGEHGQWGCVARIREAESQFMFYSICPVNAPEPVRLAMAEFLTRANYGLVVGNFELGFEEGDIRFKTSIDVEGHPLGYALIKNQVYHNVLTMDQYLPGIFAVIEGKETPQAALALVE